MNLTEVWMRMPVGKCKMMGIGKWLRNLRWLMKLKLEYPNKGGQKEFMVQE